LPAETKAPKWLRKTKETIAETSGLRLIAPDEPDRPESVVKVERRE
jgi:hypothetical protein